MTTSPTPTPQQQRDRDMTDYLYSALRQLPIDLTGAYTMIAVLQNAKREAVEKLEDAELTVLLSAPADGKNEATRELQRKQALRDSSDVKAARSDVDRYDAEIELQEAEIKGKQAEYRAALALAELHSARIAAMTTKTPSLQKDEDKAK